MLLGPVFGKFLSQIIIFSKIMSKIKKQKTSRNWIFIHPANGFDRMQLSLKPSEDYYFKISHIYHSGGQMTYRGLDRNRYKIASFHQNIMKFHKITQLLDHLILRVLRVRQHPDILGLSTLRELSKSEEVFALRPGPTTLRCC